ncbi:MAG TPA: response regulator [Candidatus Aquilonibacter sp.]|jgi:signal transduction histidine kinase|nr:response regulator [Candidatus Aquilonibacter sp.]
MFDPMQARLNARWESFNPATIDNSAIKILTVDDNEALRYSLARSLREAGYQVTEARTGEEAIALADEYPDLITLDINLPDMSGFQVCHRIKSEPRTAHIPILHISSTFVDPESRVRGLAGGADAYLAEPIDRAELVATVAALLRLKNAEMMARQQAAAAEAAREELAILNATLESRVKERTAELKAANDNLRELSTRLFKIQDDERRHISRELHDSVGQLLAGITMNQAVVAEELDKLSPEARRAFGDNRAMVQEILRGIRTISHLLHPPLLDEAGLPSALRWYVEEFGQRSGIKVTLECPDRIPRFSREMETAIFRIVQECLGNVHRHSGSSTAIIHLELNDDNVYVEISDQGHGISPERQREIKSGSRSGVGLRGIRERITQFGGELEIHSSGAGTSIVATIPCRVLTEESGDEVA